jgi:hypothetical protein
MKGLAMKRFILGLAALALLLGSAGQVAAGGGKVMPAMARPLGYTLADMAEELAFFDTTGNNLAFYPDTPFQILYADFSNPTGANTFTVKTGTKFFVPLLSIDDSPPIIGAFPANAADAKKYIFGDTQIGADNVEIEVDGVVTSIGPEYVAGPVVTPALPDGGGTHFIQVGAFLSPLSKGTHTVTVRGTFDGDALVAFLGSGISFEFTYTVIVVN